MSETNSEAVLIEQGQTQEPVIKENSEKKENLLSKTFLLMNKNPNYKMLGALVMMLINFSVCVTVANWLKNSNLVS